MGKTGVGAGQVWGQDRCGGRTEGVVWVRHVKREQMYGRDRCVNRTYTWA